MAAKKDESAVEAAGVATDSDNAKLEHSHGGVTTRDDATDVGVPMLPGDAKEPVGPEDALGPGPKRGDYSKRVGPDSYQPTHTVAVEDPKPGEATARLEAQRPHATERGDESGKKGGVETV